MSTLVPVWASKAFAISGRAKLRSAAAATCSSCAEAAPKVQKISAIENKVFLNDMDSHRKDHDFSGFNERGRRLAHFEAHFTDGIGGNDGRNLLPANRKLHLGEQAFFADLNHATHKLVAAADAAEAAPALGADLFSTAMKIAIKFMAGNPVVPAGCAHAAQLAVIDPLQVAQRA